MAKKETMEQGKVQEEKRQEEKTQGNAAQEVQRQTDAQSAEQGVRGVPALAVRIDNTYDYPDSKVKALVSVNIGNSFAIHGIRIMQSDKGLFVAMPSRNYEKNGESKYSDIFHPTTAEARVQLNDQILKVYENHMKQKEAEGQETAASEEIPNFEEEEGVSQSM